MPFDRGARCNALPVRWNRKWFHLSGTRANKRDPGAEGRYDGVMIRSIRLWTGDDGESHFEEGLIALEPGDLVEVVNDAIGVLANRVVKA